MLLPKARTENIVVQEAGEEVLIYDLITNKAYCMNKTAGIVFNACDGMATFAELRQKHPLTDDLIYLSLDELNKHGLLENTFVSPFSGMTRRNVIKKVGLASMAVLPVIMSITAPVRSEAGSLCLAPGSPTNYCSLGSGTCNSFETGPGVTTTPCCSGSRVTSSTPCSFIGPATACVCG